MRKLVDRVRYEIFYRLWYEWHCRFRTFPPFMNKVETIGLARDPKTGKLYNPVVYERRDWIATCSNSRPWWHLCCNGNAGGWRTKLCDYLEGSWRSTDYYSKGGNDGETT